jgi:hypothetical protein
MSNKAVLCEERLKLFRYQSEIAYVKDKDNRQKSGPFVLFNRELECAGEVRIVMIYKYIKEHSL